MPILTASPQEIRNAQPGSPAPAETAPAAIHPRRYSWPELMKRVFEIDILECPHCRARPMRILAAIHPPVTTLAILECLNLPSRAPPIAPARPGVPEQLQCDFGC